MSNFGKKLLSAFVEVTDDPAPVPANTTTPAVPHAAPAPAATTGNNKFRQYFDDLFKDANLPGPDYYEFSKMIAAMQSVADESARYQAAFAGLKVQGLNKDKLLQTAASYIHLLDTDAGNFNSTIDHTLQEKVHARQQEIADKNSRIQQLSQEINELHQSIALLQGEVKENEEKIAASTQGYQAESDYLKNRIHADREKIKQYIA